MFPFTHVVRNHLRGAEWRQNKGNPAPGSRLPTASSPLWPRSSLAGWPWVRELGLLRRRNMLPKLLFRSELGTKAQDSMSEGSNLD